MIDRRDFLQLSALTSLAAAAQRPVPRSEYDYVDWSWQGWRRITGESRPRVAGEQGGKPELIHFFDPKGNLIPRMKTWDERRALIVRVLSAFVGAPPRARVALAPRILEEKALAGHTRRKLSYQTEAGEEVPAYLLIPKKLRAPAPAVLCPHQTTQNGMREPAGIAGAPAQQTALELVGRGYVTLTWDALCFGERHDPASGHYGDAIPFYRKHPRWSLLGKMVWDMSRAIDYLETLGFVDPARVGSVGHSHGGITTLFGMALDERIRAGVSSCGFDTFRLDGNTWRWSHATALLPRLGFYVSSPYINMDRYRAMPDSEVVQTPFDMHELLALIAPRPLFLSTSDEDFVFPNAGWSARQALARVEPIYRFLGAGSRLGAYFFTGGHSFPADVAGRAYDWLDRQLEP